MSTEPKPTSGQPPPSKRQKRPKIRFNLDFKFNPDDLERLDLSKLVKWVPGKPAVQPPQK
jgi:hypothetical protein